VLLNRRSRMKDYSELKGKHILAWDFYNKGGTIEVFVAEIDENIGITLKYSDSCEDRQGRNYYCLNFKEARSFKNEFDFIVEDIKNGEHSKKRIDEYYDRFYGIIPCGSMVPCAFE
jgi:hypothetical protein